MRIEEDDQSAPRTALDPRVYLAAERTLLAWVRTGLALMGLGFVVAKFGLFLREQAAVLGESMPHRSGLSLWIGTALVVLGVVVNVAAIMNNRRTIRRLEVGQPICTGLFSLGTVVALSLGLIGLLMAIHLLVGAPYWK
jgi:putative membrane protein